jgi:hypothetical protein
MALGASSVAPPPRLAFDIGGERGPGSLRRVVAVGAPPGDGALGLDLGEAGSVLVPLSSAYSARGGWLAEVRLGGPTPAEGLWVGGRAASEVAAAGPCSGLCHGRMPARLRLRLSLMVSILLALAFAACHSSRELSFSRSIWRVEWTRETYWLGVSRGLDTGVAWKRSDPGHRTAGRTARQPLVMTISRRCNRLRSTWKT